MGLLGIRTECSKSLDNARPADAVAEINQMPFRTIEGYLPASPLLLHDLLLG